MTVSIVNQTIQPYKAQLLHHSLYSKIKTPHDLQCFTEHHVFAVWDFMSLLKALQIRLTCTTTPWMPVGNPEMRYLINEIVVAEETDSTAEGKRLSHFEMYLEAMEQGGADTKPIEAFLERVTATQNIFVSIRNSGLAEGIKDFLDFTFRIIEEGKPHKIAAAFTFGREDLIPEMFTEILKNFQENFPETKLDKLIYYFERHIELDADEHGPMAMQMISELCGESETRWREVTETVVEALQKRIGLWNTIEREVTAKLDLV